MTASDRSLFGFAKQPSNGAKGTLATSGFQYLLFSRGSAGVQNMTIPMDPEVGGGALLRDVVKTGVTSGGALEFIPRPTSLGMFLMGAFGQDTVTPVIVGGTKQVETATVAGVTVTGAGNVVVTVTANNLPYSPATYNVPVLVGDTLSVVATKIMNFLKADANLAAIYTITTNGANIIFTATQALANDATFNCAIAVGTQTGVTAAATSANTTSGVAGLSNAVYSHAFTLPSDQYAAPYYSVRYAPGNLWGETYQDCRFSSLSLNWRGANFVRGAVSFVGGTPTPGVATTGWGTPLDSTPPFITPISTVELPTGTNAKVLAGSFQSTMAIPMDQQWIVGSYIPDDFDIVSRAYILQLTVKVTDSSLYNKMMYDGDGTVSAWAADMYRQSQFNIQFQTAQNIPAVTPATPWSLKIEGNGSAAPNGNVVWTAAPLGLRAGQQVIMAVTGVFLADATQAIKVSLQNDQSAAY